MKLDGIHHITAITADAARNVDFYARLLGLRLVKKSVNQDDPTVYHLFYGDEEARPGADLTFFEYPDAAPGRLGAGMVHTIEWQVADTEAIRFWAERLGGEDIEVEVFENGDRLMFADFEGLRHELVAEPLNAPLVAAAADIPAEFALQGFRGARAYAQQPEASDAFYTETMGFEREGACQYVMQGDNRTSHFRLDQYDEPGSFGRGVVHHIAWWSHTAEQPDWRRRIAAAGLRPTGIIDRHYFRSVYFLEPSGVLFELATGQPGFAVDEDPERLGERLSLPPRFEPLRDQLEETLAPLPNPRLATRR